MAEAISDERVAAVLRVFVRGCAPMVQRLREDGEPVEIDADEAEVDRSLLDKVKDQLAQVKFPGSDAWARMNPDDRSDWWVSRVGRLTALVASFTGLAGAIGDRFPLQDMLGSAGQGLLLCAIASEHGVDDRGTRVRLLASVLFERDIAPEVARGKGDDAADEETVQQLAADATVGEVEEPPKGKKFGLKAAAKILWRQGRMLMAISDELGKRPQGRFYHKALGMLPVVGMAGDYLGERSALKRAAKAGNKWLVRHAAGTQ
ncbi:hypothetical protein [Actinocrispum sp. NPDC049592]|uniref:hypothetical protein n=1 Tax=Actinocrispum sp. NPDC049592 TaxID=3154835 RepID=UPI0034286AD3